MICCVPFSRKAAILTAVAMSVTSCTAAVASDVVLAFHQDALLERFGLETRAPTVSPSGMAYGLVENGRTIGTLRIGVHPTVPNPTVWRNKLAFSLSRGPDIDAAEGLEDLGDGRLVLGNRIHVLRGNVTFMVKVDRSWDRTLSIARAIDDAIQNDPAVAPKGAFEETPRIETVGAPAEVEPLETPRHVDVVTSWTTLHPVFKGLGDPAKLNVLVVGDHFWNLAWTVEQSRAAKVRTRVHSMETFIDPRPTDTRRLRPDEDGRFFLIASPQAQPGKTYKVTMAAVNVDNVVATKEFEVRVAEQP